VACGVGLALLAVLVQAGVTHSLDRYTLDHLQPLATGSWSDLTLPADPLVAAVAVAAGTVVLARRDGWRRAWPWPAALLLSVAVEAAGKEWVSQIPFAAPERVLDLFSLPGTFPSGHTARAAILAGLVCALRPRLWRWAVGSAAFVAVWVVVSGMHVASDALGGLLLGAGLALWALREGDAGARRGAARPPG